MPLYISAVRFLNHHQVKQVLLSGMTLLQVRMHPPSSL